MGLELYSKIFFILFFIALSLICGIYFIKNSNILPTRYRNKEILLEELLFIDNKNKIALIKNKKAKYLLLLGEKNNILIDRIDEN
jgi:hypothetical protein